MFEHTHMHSQDRYDSYNAADEVCRRLKEIGCSYCVLTQHAVTAAVESMKDAAKKYGLNFVPGVETYYVTKDGKKCHMVLLSKDYTGWLAISKAITKSQDKDGYSVMTEEIIREYFGEGSKGHGHVFFLSACIRGVFASILRTNEDADKETLKLLKKYENTVPEGTEDRLSEVTEELLKYRNELSETESKIQIVKEYADKRYAARDKALARLQGEPEYEEQKIALEKEKKLTEQAKAELQSLKEQKAKVSKLITSRNQEVKKLTETVARGQSYKEAIHSLREKYQPEEELLSMCEEEMHKMAEIFGADNFYIEIQYHGMEEEREIYPRLVALARRNGYPIIATNDCHIVLNTESELLRRNTLRALRFGTWEDVTDSDKELYIKSSQEMKEALSKIYAPDVVKEAMENTVNLTARCHVEFPKETHYPVFPCENGKTPEDVFDEEIEKGIHWRFPNGMSEEYQKRLSYEIGIIKQMKYVNYHLIVADFIREARQYGRYVVGVGRGSAAGSLVCYLLGISGIDPMKYGLYFERYLNPERVSMPDIDTDIAKRVRGKVIEYTRKKYGENAVCGILTTNSLAPKGCIRMAAKYYALSRHEDANRYLPLANKIAKTVPSDVGTLFDSELDNGETVYEMLLRTFDSAESCEILAWAKSLEGSFTAYGAHAAGIVISDNDDISDYMPLRWNEKLSEYTTQCDMIKVEENGYLKMDLLGLKTLDIITDCLGRISENYGIDIDVLKLNMEDPIVYREIFQKGRTDSVFQFESQGMKSMLKRFRPVRFEDLIILVSMFRPGPLQFLDSVIAVKNGKTPEYVCPEVEPILRDTYSAITYQEQVMTIFQQLAGYTLGGADMVRRYMSKKKADKLAHEREAFVNGDPERNIPGCVANGISADAANKLFDQMTEFAKYCFNKSHATAYAYNSYITAWLKYYYPAEFLAAALNFADADKIPGLMREAAQFGIKTCAPSVNHADDQFKVEDNKIYFGMSAVKGVGQAASEILSEREKNGKYTSLLNFFLRTNVSKAAIENLIKAGAFDDFCQSRTAMVKGIDEYKKFVKKYRDAESQMREAADEKTYEKASLKLKNAENDMRSIILPSSKDDPVIRLQEEYEFLGEFVSDDPLSYYKSPLEYGACEIGHITTEDMRVFGVCKGIDVKKRKRDGKEMAFVTLEDETGEIVLNFFTEAYSTYSELLHVGQVLLVTGTVETEEEERDDETVTIYKLNVKRCVMPERKDVDYVMEVSSYPIFHTEDEEAFMDKYAVSSISRKRGHKFFIRERITGELREMKYRVSDRVIDLPNVSEH